MRKPLLPPTPTGRVLASLAAMLVACASGALAVDAPPGAPPSPGSPACKLERIAEWKPRPVRDHVVVDGAINGQPVAIVLDTGAQRTLVLRGAAQRLGLPLREARGVRSFGIGGELRVEIADVDEFRLGDSVTRHARFLVTGERDLGTGIDVLLGLDFLQSFDVEFDPAAGAVRLFRPHGCDGRSLAYWSRAPIGEVEIEALSSSRPRLAFPVRVNGIAVDAILDSGAATSVITRRDAEAAGVSTGTAGVSPGPRIGGLGARTIESWVGTFASFGIGNETIRDVPLRFADLYRETKYVDTASRVPRSSLRNQPMILGADFLRSHRTLIAHSQRRIYFEYLGGPVFDVRAASIALQPTEPGAGGGAPP